MTAVTAPSHDHLAHMADDINQLTQPIHIAIHRQIHTHPPLLDQLRQATQPGSTQRGPEQRSIPESRPPAGLDAIDTLTTIYVDLAHWHRTLGLPSPPEFIHGCHHTTCRRILLRRGTHGPVCQHANLHRIDWHKAALRQLVGAAPTLAPSIADDLANTVHDWWRKAATTVGWRPADLRNVR